MKNLIVIGGLGNIGFQLLKKIERDAGLNITCIARISKKNKLKAKKLKNIQFVWSDIIKQDISPFLKNADIVLNLAAILPPESETNPEYSNKVNYLFTKELLTKLNTNTKLIFLSTSGISFYNSSSKSKLFYKNYLTQKKKSEDVIMKSTHHFTIIRPPFIFDNNFPPITSSLFEIPLDNRMEFIHMNDVIESICKSFKAKGNQIINLGGNHQCQITYKEYLQFCFAGYTPTNKSLFTQNYYPTDWVHSYNIKQRISFKEMVKEVHKKNPFTYLYRKLLISHIIKHWEKQSPYITSSNKTATN